MSFKRVLRQVVQVHLLLGGRIAQKDFVVAEYQIFSPSKCNFWEKKAKFRAEINTSSLEYWSNFGIDIFVVNSITQKNANFALISKDWEQNETKYW